MNVFDEMGVYWAEMADQNQTEKQVQFLKNHLELSMIVLDVACGTGRHIIPLSQQGYHMVGLDVSLNLLRIAKQRSKETQLIRGDMRFLPFKAEAFGAAISVDTSFGYLPAEVEDRVSLVEIKRVLTKRSVFIIDVFNRQELTQKYKDKNQLDKQKEYPHFFLQQKRNVSPEGDWLCDLWIIQDKLSGQLSTFEHEVRLYERTELEGMLENAGFEVKEVYGGYENGKFSSQSPHLLLIVETK